jgi:hypothetical protein
MLEKMEKDAPAVKPPGKTSSGKQPGKPPADAATLKGTLLAKLADLQRREDKSGLMLSWDMRRHVRDANGGGTRCGRTGAVI